MYLATNRQSQIGVVLCNSFAKKELFLSFFEVQPFFSFCSQFFNARGVTFILPFFIFLTDAFLNRCCPSLSKYYIYFSISCLIISLSLLFYLFLINLYFSHSTTFSLFLFISSSVFLLLSFSSYLLLTLSLYFLCLSLFSFSFALPILFSSLRICSCSDSHISNFCGTLVHGTLVHYYSCLMIAE